MDSLSLKQYIYDHKKIPDILESLKCHKIKYHDNQDYYSAAQPDGDNPQGVIINNNTYLNYISYSRGIGYEQKSDIITLVESIKHISFVDAFKYLHQVLGLDYKHTRIHKLKSATIDPLYIFKKYDNRNYIDVSHINVLDENMLDDFIPIPHISWVKEGIIVKPTLEKFGIAYSYKKKRIIIPHRSWLTGELLGINSRTTVDNYEELGINKYWIAPSYKKALNVYGFWEHKDAIQKAKIVTIFEGEKSVLKRHTLLDETGVAISGKFLSDEQVRIICGLNINEIVIAFDKDVSIEEVRHACSKFYKIRKVSYILDKWDVLNAKDSPADANNKNYQFLFDNRITFNYHEYEAYQNSLKKR